MAKHISADFLDIMLNRSEQRYVRGCLSAILFFGASGCSSLPPVHETHTGNLLPDAEVAIIDNRWGCAHCIDWIRQGDRFVYIGAGGWRGEETFVVNELGTRMAYSATDASNIRLPPGRYEISYIRSCYEGPTYARREMVSVLRGHHYRVASECTYPFLGRRTVALWIEDSFSGTVVSGDKQLR